MVLLDEFEHLGLRRDREAGPAEPLTAEFLRDMPALRERQRILIACATNHIRLLEPALLRPGRFDLLLPIGLPDAPERAAVLARLLRRHQCGRLELETVVVESDGLTLADLDCLCQRAAQRAFERELEGAEGSVITTDDLLAVTATYRRTIEPDDIQAFHEDVERFARF